MLAAATAMALLARSSAPDGVRLALDLLPLAFAARAALRFTRAVWQWERTLLALTNRRVLVVAPRGAVRRAWQAMSLAGIHSAGVSHSFGGRLLGYGTLTLGDGPQGREVRYVERCRAHRRGDPRRRPARPHADTKRGAGCL